MVPLRLYEYEKRVEAISFGPSKLGRSVLRPYMIEADVSSAAQK